MEEFTNKLLDDTLFPEYKTWEEIPVSNLNFNSNTSQICYIALTKDEAIRACKIKAIPKSTIAYEYKDEVPLKENQVILAIEIDTSGMLDLTHKPDYIIYMNSKINNTKLNDVSIIRRVQMDSSIIQFKIVYILMNNAKIKNVQKT